MRIPLFILNTARRYVAFIFAGPRGHHGVNVWGRLRIAARILWTYASLRKSSASTPTEQLALVNAVLSLQRTVQGDLAEFGCFKGVASCALSLAARATGRRLVIFDSFEGLPEPAEAVHNITGQEIRYHKGEFKGSLEEVRHNIECYGAPEVVEYVSGYFSDTLPARVQDRFALIFEDADLVESVRCVLSHAWPRLSPGGLFFCHEARDREVVQLFYDQPFWRTIWSAPAPGLVGGGVGLPLDPLAWTDEHLRGGIFFWGSCLGYVVKA